MKKTLKVSGIDCANCAQELEDKIKKIEGIENVSLSFMTERLVYECREEEAEDVLKRVKKIINKEEPDADIKEI